MPSRERIIGSLLLVATLCAGNVRAQPCSSPKATVDLNVNEVRARLANNGGLLIAEPTAYEVPKYGGVGTMFQVGLTVGGRRDTTIAVTASSLSRKSDYRAGPLNDGSSLPVDCNRYDRMWLVSRADIETFDATGLATPDLANWPTGLGAPTVDINGFGIDLLDRPINDRKDRLIDLQAGERPQLKGDQMAWWITNDGADSLPGNDKGEPVGLEIHASAFAFSSDGPLDYTTFYRYRLFYRHNDALSDAYIGLFVDGDAGYNQDDYMGTDTLRQMAFFYNGDNDDEGQSNSPGYGEAPPAVAVTFLQSPVGLSHTIPTWGSHHWPDGYPISSIDHFNRLQGRWIDSTRMKFGYNGHDGSGPPSNFIFPARPGEYWSESVPGYGSPMAPSDRSLVMSSGPLLLNSGDEFNLAFAIVWSRSTDNLAAVDQLRTDVDKVHDYWGATMTGTAARQPADGGNHVEFGSAFPNPFDEKATITFTLRHPTTVEVTMFDALGRVVRTLFNDILGTGAHAIPVSGGSLPDGVYFAKLQAGDRTFVRKLIRYTSR